MNTFKRDAVKKAIKPIVELVATVEEEHTEEDLTTNTLDCFGSLIDSATQQISINAWKQQEKSRQIQKTKQNAIGNMHERILSTIDGVQQLPVGNVCDIRCDRLKIIAEVKNKWNTTKGNHKVQIYNDLSNRIEKLNGYTGYYVEILPKNGKSYNEPFTPSNNLTHRQTIERNDIRKIDGRTFYGLLTGNEKALDELYMMMPCLVAEILNEKDREKYDTNFIERTIKSSDDFINLYHSVYHGIQ
jgi:hypothetical protein